MEQRRCVDLGELAPEWQGWFIDEQGRLCGDAVRWKFEAGDLLAYPYSQAETKARARENDQLKRELARASEDLEVAEQRREFYRRNLVAEGRLGVLGVAFSESGARECFVMRTLTLEEHEANSREVGWLPVGTELSGEDMRRVVIGLDCFFELYGDRGLGDEDDEYAKLMDRLVELACVNIGGSV